MAGATVSITNDNRKAFKNALKNQLTNGLISAGATCEGYAKGLCPVDTGRLRGSITHEVSYPSVQIGTNVEYASYVELGTSRQSAQPYLVPAGKNHQSEYASIIRKNLMS